METTNKTTIKASSLKSTEVAQNQQNEVLTVREYINNLLKEGWNFEENLKGFEKKKSIHFYFVGEAGEIEHKYLNFKLEAANKIKDFAPISKESKFLNWEVKSYVDHNGKVKEYIAEPVILERKQQELF